MKKLFCITILLSLMLLLASCSLGPVSIEISDSTASSNSSGPFKTIEIGSDSFEIDSIEFEYKNLGSLGEQTSVTFTIRNYTGESLSELGCFFDFIDENGDSIDSGVATYYGHLDNEKACTVDGVYHGERPYGLSITHMDCTTVEGEIGGFYYSKPIVVYYSEQPIFDISNNTLNALKRDEGASSGIIRGISWNMTKDDVISIEESRSDSGKPYEHGASLIFLIDSFEYYGEPCESIIYTCNFKNKNGNFGSYVEEISLDYSNSSYEKLLFTMKDELGEPSSEALNLLDSESTSHYWKTSDSIISLVYFDGVTRVIFKPVN